MKQLLLASILYFAVNISFGQDTPIELTPEILKKITADVDVEVIKLRQKLSKEELNIDEMEFRIDTFRIETIASKRMDIDYSTAGINITVSEKTTSYDKLMNKYYNKLMKSLKPEDKKILISAQKAWLTYRDAEIKLINTMGDDVYSGGGTIQSNIKMAAYESLVINRTLEIFSYFNCIIKD